MSIGSGLCGCDRVVVISKRQKPSGLQPGGFLLCGRFDQAGLPPAAVLGDGDALAARRQLNEHGALSACNQALAGAAAEAVELAPLAESQNAVVIDTGLMQYGSIGHFGAAIHWKLLKDCECQEYSQGSPCAASTFLEKNWL
jgi:hypothetical protein